MIPNCCYFLGSADRTTICNAQSLRGLFLANMRSTKMNPGHISLLLLDQDSGLLCLLTDSHQIDDQICIHHVTRFRATKSPIWMAVMAF
ncbi:MAG: hypothetical protein C9356_19605 [Oleiphilus sp.]|nr:MAG: hypothetical protein C9356_19605 [Oleiphilus sp.]